MKNNDFNEDIEKVIFEIPSETKEDLEKKKNFEWTIDLEIFSKFWGLYFMGSVIPDYIWDYVCENKDKIVDVHQLQALHYIIGAPIKQDSFVRQMVFVEVM